MKKTATFVLLALFNSCEISEATRLLKTNRISADSFSDVGETDNSSSNLMKMTNSKSE